MSKTDIRQRGTNANQKRKRQTKENQQFCSSNLFDFFSKFFCMKNGRGRVRFPNPHARNNCINFWVNYGYKNQTYPGRIS